MLIDAYNALRESAAVFDLAGRGHIQLTGDDRARLLHAMTTNHVEDLVPGQCRYAFFLSAQGRILADANILCTERALILDTEPETAAAVLAHLDRYIIADDVTLQDSTAHIAALALEGPLASAVLERMGIEAPPPDRWVEWRTWIVAGLSAAGGTGFRFFVPLAERESLLAWIVGAGAIEAGRPEWNAVRVENGVARYGEDITEQQIPHETGLVTRAISFSKGCYLGQEIVERVRSRGQVNRQLARVTIPGEVAPPPQTKLLLGGKEIGAITSAVRSPAQGEVVAMAMLRAEAMRPGAHYTFEGGTAVFVGATAPRSS